MGKQTAGISKFSVGFSSEFHQKSEPTMKAIKKNTNIVRVDLKG
jgi:hypothetical protein